MASAGEEEASLADRLLNTINIHVHSPCIPPRQQPLDCYMPHHVAYTSHHHDQVPCIDPIMQSAVPGAAPRRIEREDGEAWVYDRDVVTSWRLLDVRRAYEVFF